MIETTTYPDAPYRAALQLEREVLRGDWIANTDKGWWRWTGTHWKTATDRELDNILYPVLDGAEWQPDPTKLGKVRHALRSIKWTPDAKPGHTLDGMPLPAGYIAVANGILDVGTGEVLEHDRSRFVTSILPWSYDPDATCHAWLDFLNSPYVFDGEEEAIRLLRMWFGYIVSGRMDLHKIMYLKGRPRSGKGTIFRVLPKLIGRANSTVLDFESGGNWFNRTMYVGKTLAVCGDARFDDVKSTAALRMLLGIAGEDDQQINTHGANPFPWTPTVRFVIGSNELPSIVDNSGALGRRLSVLVTAGEVPEGAEDRTLDGRLEAELPGIAAWAVAGLRDLEQAGDFVSASSAVSAVSAVAFMGEMMHPVRTFLSSMGWALTGDDGDFLPVNPAYDRYAAWARAEGVRVLTKADFRRELDAMGVRSGSRVQNRVDGRLVQTLRGVRGVL